MIDDELAAVEALVAAGDDGAFARLRGALAWPRGKTIAPGALSRWIALVAKIAVQRGATDLASIAEAAARDPDSPDQLYALGYALIDAGVPGLAASVLWHCLALVGDSEEVVCELVSALESALAYADAFAILAEHAALRQRSFLARYLYAFNAAMTGKLAITREVLPTLEPDGVEAAALQSTITQLVARADRVAGVTTLDARDLRGWHYVLTGGLLTHQSPYGFDGPMHGRYAWLADSLPRLATGIERLVALVRPLALPCVYAPPGRDHEIVGYAIAQRLGVPLVPWPTIGVPAPGIVALYDLAELPRACVSQLVQRRPDQVMFAHASPWTLDSPVAPEVTTLLYQALVAPWGASTIVDPATRQVSSTAPDERDARAIVADLLASPGLDDGELVADQRAQWDALVSRAWPPSPAPRSRLWAGGPVPSSRFP